MARKARSERGERRRNEIERLGGLPDKRLNQTLFTRWTSGCGAVLEEAINALGFKRRGKKIVAALEQAIAAARR